MKRTARSAALSALTVLALAAGGGSYASFSTSVITPPQGITSGVAAMSFTNDMKRATFASEFNNLTSGDELMTSVALHNGGTLGLKDLRLRAELAGDVSSLGSNSTEGLQVDITKVAGPGTDGEWGTQDDVLDLKSPVLSTTKLANLTSAVPINIGSIGAGETYHLRFAVKVPKEAVKQNQNLNVTYFLDATGSHDTGDGVFPDGASVQVAQSQSILTDFNKDGALSAGDTIKYQWAVTNDGTVEQKNVSIESAYLKSVNVGIFPPLVETLAPGETTTFTAQYSPTMDQVNNREALALDSTIAAVPTGCGPSGCSAMLNVKSLVTSVANGTASATAKPGIPTNKNFVMAPVKLSIARNYPGSGVDAQGRVYAMGGDSPAGTSMDRYDPVAGTVETFSMPRSWSFGRAVTDASNGLIIMGTASTTDAGREIRRFDANTKTWSIIGSMNTTRNDVAMVMDSQGRIYVIGGRDKNWVWQSTNQRWNPTTGIWENLAPMPTPRGQGHVANIDKMGNIYIFGGQNSAGLVSSVVKYDPVANAWTTLPSMPDHRNFSGLAIDGNDTLWVVGGHSSGAGVKVPYYPWQEWFRRNLVAYNTKSNVWALHNEMLLTTGRNLPATAIVGGTFVAMGGGMSSQQKDIEVIRP